MAITVTCPACEGQMSAPDQAVGKKGKCPKCGEVLVIPGPFDAPRGRGFLDEPSPYAPPATIPSEDVPAAPAHLNGKGGTGTPLAVISGKPASLLGSTGAVSSTFGRTTLTLLPGRLLERTTRPISGRDCVLLLGELDSAELVTRGNPLWIALGFLTLWAVIGLAFFVVYFLQKHRFLIVRSRANAVIVAVEGDDGPYRRFMEAVLTEAEHAKATVAL